MIASYTPACYRAVNLAGGYTAPAGLAVNFELDTVLEGVAGPGYLAGAFPGGITTVKGIPTSATVRVLYRPEEGTLGDGVLVAQVQSAPDGTWRVDGLDPALKFDVIGRKQGFRDVILPGLSPKPY